MYYIGNLEQLMALWRVKVVRSCILEELGHNSIPIVTTHQLGEPSEAQMNNTQGHY